MSIFTNGQGIIVSARGPGKLHLLTFKSIVSGAGDVVGTITTAPSTPDKVTRFIISFSHNYTKFAFFWDGAGQAVFGKGQDLVRQPLGNSWNVATTVDWGSASFTTQDVRAIATSATNRDNETTCYIIPDNLL
jgi:hypothetical protein